MTRRELIEFELSNVKIVKKIEDLAFDCAFCEGSASAGQRYYELRIPQMGGLKMQTVLIMCDGCKKSLQTGGMMTTNGVLARRRVNARPKK